MDYPGTKEKSFSYQDKEIRGQLFPPSQGGAEGEERHNKQLQCKRVIMRSMVTSCFQCYEGLHKTRALKLWEAAWSLVVRDSSFTVRVMKHCKGNSSNFLSPKSFPNVIKCDKVHPGVWIRCPEAETTYIHTHTHPEILGTRTTSIIFPMQSPAHARAASSSSHVLAGLGCFPLSP